MNCKECKYYYNDVESMGNIHRCRRYPKEIMVIPGYWCGEYRYPDIKTDIDIGASKSIYSQEFETFWKIYPKRMGKGGAWRAWVKLKPDCKTVEAILCAVGICSNSDQWRKDGGQWVPMPQTWLNQRRWEDDLQQVIGVDDSLLERSKHFLDSIKDGGNS